MRLRRIREEYYSRSDIMLTNAADLAERFGMREDFLEHKEIF